MAGTAFALIRPDWPAPPGVRAVATTRAGGFSTGRYASLNLGDHVDDDPKAVAGNRAQLIRAAGLPAPPRWLNQVHGPGIALAEAITAPPDADAAVTGSPGVVCAVLTADCLPVLFCDRYGRRVAAVHAGWRGLAAGILEAVLADFSAQGIPGEDLLAWLGPAIGPAAYEVDAPVRDAFNEAPDAAAFTANTRGRWQLDLYRLAAGRLRTGGVPAIYGGDRCTYDEPDAFFSYRRDGPCGRQASLIWLDDRDRG